MSNYTKLVDFAAKDSLPTGDAGKLVKGTEINTEFANLQTAVNSKADYASPALTGTPTAPTAATATNNTQIATTAYVKANLGTKADLASPTFTGVPLAPTAATDTDTTQIATTAFVQDVLTTIDGGTY
jgi:hypothetical protein